MKPFSLIIISLLLSTMMYSQQENQHRYIDVTGSADIVIQADEIELEITLKEYHSKITKVFMPSIESKFFKILETHNICKEDVTFSNADFYWYYWWSHYRKNGYHEKNYSIRLDAGTNILDFVKALDYKGVHALNIINTSNKDMQNLRRDLKISAVKAAKEKANYLLASIDEKVGRVISIVEVPSPSNQQWGRRQAIVSNVSIKSHKAKDAIENIGSINLRYEIKARFEIN